MSSNSTLIQQLLISIQDCLQNHLSKNAIFLSERLMAECDNEETRSLMADCYIQDNKHYKAYAVL
jgi:anaphase-promoting complex subunit 3